jgi:hypothetical protein
MSKPFCFPICAPIVPPDKNHIKQRTGALLVLPGVVVRRQGCPFQSPMPASTGTSLTSARSQRGGACVADLEKIFTAGGTPRGLCELDRDVFAGNAAPTGREWGPENARPGSAVCDLRRELLLRSHSAREFNRLEHRSLRHLTESGPSRHAGRVLSFRGTGYAGFLKALDDGAAAALLQRHFYATVLPLLAVPRSPSVKT